MLTLLSLLLIGQPTQASSETPDVSSSLAELFRLSDEYRQCLILDKSTAAEPKDTYSAEGGTSAENLDLMLADRQDRLLKQLIEKGRSSEILDAISRVQYTQVSDKQCYAFDPYYGPALEKLVELEKVIGVQAEGGRNRWRRQRPR